MPTITDRATWTVDVRTVKAGRDYRATVSDGHDRLIGTYRLILDADAGMVAIYTPQYTLGLYRLDRFGETLSPPTVRAFFLTDTQKAGQ